MASQDPPPVASRVTYRDVRPLGDPSRRFDLEPGPATNLANLKIFTEAYFRQLEPKLPLSELGLLHRKASDAVCRKLQKLDLQEIGTAAFEFAVHGVEWSLFFLTYPPERTPVFPWRGHQFDVKADDDPPSHTYREWLKCRQSSLKDEPDVRDSVKQEATTMEVPPDPAVASSSCDAVVKPEPSEELEEKMLDTKKTVAAPRPTRELEVSRFARVGVYSTSHGTMERKWGKCERAFIPPSNWLSEAEISSNCVASAGDRHLRDIAWRAEVPHCNWGSVLCDPFELAIPDFMDSRRFVQGIPGQGIDEINKMFVGGGVALSWVHDGVEKLVVEFTAASGSNIDPRDPMVRQSLFRTWESLVRWMTEALLGRPVPLFEHFHELDLSRYVLLRPWLDDMLAICQQTDLPTRAVCNAFRHERALAVWEIELIHFRHETVDEIKEKLAEWAPRLTIGGKLDIPQRLSLARFVWLQLSDQHQRPAIRHYWMSEVAAAVRG